MQAEHRKMSPKKCERTGDQTKATFVVGMVKEEGIQILFLFQKQRMH